MIKAENFVYHVGKNIYINLTNRCPCACTFCIRQNGDGAYGSGSLWLAREPSADEVLSIIAEQELSEVSEFVFCGYGEPMERAEDVSYIGKELKRLYGKSVRLNTNGLSDLIHGKETAYLLEGAVDVVSISLNSGDEESYLKVTRPKFGKGSFEAMQKFAVDCKKYVPNVMFTVVDVIPEREIELAKEISEKLGITLRIRKYES